MFMKRESTAGNKINTINTINTQEEINMRDTMYTKAEVNEAIYTVLTTQFKKQEP